MLSLAIGCGKDELRVDPVVQLHDRSDRETDKGNAQFGETFDFTLPGEVWSPLRPVKLSHSVEITNATAELVEFGELQSSCGCTSARLEHDSILPGEKTRLFFQIALAEVSGTKRVSLNLPVRDGKPWLVSIEVTANRVAEFAPSSSRILDLEPRASAIGVSMLKRSPSTK